MESFSLNSRVGASQNFMAREFFVTRESPWEFIAMSRSWLRTMHSGQAGRGSYLIEGLWGVSNSDISAGSAWSSSSLMNSSTSFSMRDPGESTRRIPLTSSIGSESRDCFVMEFVALAIWAEKVSFPDWAMKRFKVFLWFLDRSSSNWKERFGGAHYFYLQCSRFGWGFYGWIWGCGRWKIGFSN